MIIKHSNIQKVQDAAEPIYKVPDAENSVALEYARSSKLNRVTAVKLGMKVSEFLSNPYFQERHVLPFKPYTKSEKISLPKIGGKDLGKSMYEALTQRRSTRTFNKNYKLSLQEISTLLYCAYGVSGRAKVNEEEDSPEYLFRTVPSGGGLYPLEIYLALFNSEAPSGLYHYRPELHAIEKLKSGNFAKDLKAISGADLYIDLETTCAFVMMTSVFERTMIKYGDRGYRFILLETGFVSQNLTIACEELDLGSCMLGGYLDDEINQFLDVDGTKETVQNVMTIGKKAQSHE